MHMMFVDESGDPGYPISGIWSGWGGSRLFARVGVIIHGWKWKAWHERLFQFKHNRGLTWDAEILETWQPASGLWDKKVANVACRQKKRPRRLSPRQSHTRGCPGRGVKYATVWLLMQ
jgi:hypothetical protein